jgi:predicted PurR-regulated permease PerM
MRIKQMVMENKKFGFFFLIFIVFALSVKFYFIIEEFVPSIATAFVLAYIFNPIYGYLLKITKRQSLSAFIVILIIFTLVLIPFSMIVFRFQQEIPNVLNENTYNLIQNSLTSIQDFVYREFSFNISDNIEAFKNQLYGDVQNAVTIIGRKIIFSVSGFALSAFLTIFIMYYLLIHSAKVIETFIQYFPLSYSNCAALLREIALNTRSLVLGQLFIAVIQGTLTGLGFLVFGISGAFIFGFVTVIMSFLPLFGTMMVWLPAGLIQLALHNYVSGIGIILWGFILVGNIDNLVRPKLISSMGNIHPVTVLLGVFIGLIEWGFIGLVIGPLLITLLLLLIKMFREEYLVEPDKNNNSELTPNMKSEG